MPARPPLRTVLESFPSYGSSPHKAGLSARPTRRPKQRPRRQASLAVIVRGRTALCLLRLQRPGRINRRVSVVICFSWFVTVPQTFLPFQTRPTWAYPAHYTLALAFSVLPRLRPRTRLAVMFARTKPGRGQQRFHVLQCSQDDLGSPYTPAVRRFVSGDVTDPELDCSPFGSSLISLFGLLTFTMLASVHLVLTVSSNSSAPPG